MNVKFSARNVDKVKKFIASLPLGAKIAAMEAFSEYVVGDENHGLKQEPEQKTHGVGNPYEWQSENQRRAFFASDGFGRGIPTVRTHEGVNSWTVISKNSNWTQVKIEGGNVFVQGDWQQKGHKRDGWRKYSEILKTNMAGGIRHAMSKVNEFLKKKGK